MPELLSFLPSARIIVDATNNRVSLIDVLDVVAASIPANREVESNAAAAITWAAFSLWFRVEGDDGKRFEQRVVLYDPDGQELVDGRLEFELSARTHRAMTQVEGFPIGREGEHRLQLYLREIPGEFGEALASYPIGVKHQRVPVAENAALPA